MIANIELHERGALDENLLTTLLLLSLEASFLSKAALVWMMGSKPLKSLVLKVTALLILSTAIGWSASRYLF